MHRQLNIKLLAWALGSLLLAGAGIHVLHGYQVQRNASVFRDQAEKAASEGQIQEAAAAFHRYLVYRPGDNDALARYALLLDQLADSPAAHYRALQALEQALRHQPDRNDWREQAVRIALALYRFDDAAHHLEVLLERTPGKADLEYALGWCQESSGDYSQAAATYAQALRHNPKNLAGYQHLAELEYTRLGRPRQAGKVLDDLVAANPKSAKAYLQRARYQQRLGALKEAWADLVHARQLAPGDAAVLLAGAELAQQRGDLTAAREWVERGLDLHPQDLRLYQVVAALDRRARRLTDAMAAVRRGLAKNPGAPELLVSLADLLADSEDLKAASAAIARAREAGADPAVLDCIEARLLARQERWDDAQQLLEKARPQLSARTSWQAQADLLLARCFGRLGDAHQQEAASRRALAADPSWPAARVELGTALLSLGRSREAATALRRASASPEAPVETWSLLARALLDEQLLLPAAERDLQEAAAALAKADKLQPGTGAGLALHAELLALEGRVEEAAVVLQRACRQHPEAAFLWAAWADLEQRRGDEKAAFSLLALAGKELREPLELRLAWARYWSTRAGQMGCQALRQLLVDASQLPANQQTRLQRAIADDLYRLGDAASAARTWRELTRRLPTDLDSRVRLLEIAVAEGNSREIKKLVDDLRRIEGDNGTFWRYGEAARLLGQARGGQRSDIAPARKLLGEAAQRRPKWACIPLLEAAADEIEGNTEAAVQHYLQALEQGEKNRQVLAHVARLLYQRRQYEQADDVVRQAEEQGMLDSNLARLGAEAALKRHDLERALVLARTAVPPAARDYRDHLWHAQVLDAAGKPQEAEAALRRAVLRAGAAPDPWVALVRHLVQQGQRTQAEIVVDEAKRRIAPDRFVLVEARCQEALGNSGQAEKSFLTYLKDRPDDFLALRSAAEFYLHTGKPLQAQSLLRRLLDPAVGAPAEVLGWARRQLALALTRDSRPAAFAEALALLQRNEKVFGRSQEDARARAVVLATKPDRAREALALLEQSRHDSPLSAEQQFLLARLCDANGQPDRGRDLMLELLNADAQNPHYLAYYVRRLLTRRDTSEAQAYLERLEQVEPNSARTRELQDALRRARKTP
jgi:predicted Zn-dependent protease